jgi:TRAP-type mannitol/chloroaromatic compound transport system substrate-binding protein
MNKRKFLAGGAAAGASALAFPMVARAQAATISLRFQSTWPLKFIYHEFAMDWCKKASDLTGGRLKIEMLPAGAVVPGLQVVDGVSKGVIDGGHGLPAYWFGKNIAFGLYGAGPDFGHGRQPAHGLGRVRRRQGALQRDPGGRAGERGELPGRPVPCEPMGWFRKEIRGPQDLKGLKFRTAGLAVDMFSHLGMATIQMGAPDIVPALDRGVIDGAEFASASDDLVMGFPDVAKFYLQQSYHMANNFTEVLVNKAKHDTLPEEVKAILKYVPARRALGHDVEIDASHVAGLHRHADQEQGEDLPHAQDHPGCAAQGLGHGDREALGGESALREGGRLAEGVGQAGDVLAQQRAGEPGRRLPALLPEGAPGLASQRQRNPDRHEHPATSLVEPSPDPREEATDALRRMRDHQLIEKLYRPERRRHHRELHQQVAVADR